METDSPPPRQRVRLCDSSQRPEPTNGVAPPSSRARGIRRCPAASVCRSSREPRPTGSRRRRRSSASIRAISPTAPPHTTACSSRFAGRRSGAKGTRHVGHPDQQPGPDVRPLHRSSRQLACEVVAGLPRRAPLIPAPAHHEQLLLESEVFYWVLGSQRNFFEFPFGIQYVQPTADGIRLHLESNASLDSLLAGLLPGRVSVGTGDDEIHGLNGCRITARSERGIELRRLGQPTGSGSPDPPDAPSRRPKPRSPSASVSLSLTSEAVALDDALSAPGRFPDVIVGRGAAVLRTKWPSWSRY